MGDETRAARAMVEVADEAAAAGRLQMAAARGLLAKGPAMLDRADIALNQASRIPAFRVVSFEFAGPKVHVVYGSRDAAIAKAKASLAGRGVSEVQVMDETYTVVFAESAGQRP